MSLSKKCLSYFAALPIDPEKPLDLMFFLVDFINEIFWIPRKLKFQNRLKQYFKLKL